MSMKKKGKGFSYAIFLCLALNTSLVLAQGRDSWQQPERVMNVIGIKPGMTIGQVGAGKGYFTFKMARRVGSDGRIYANDIDQEALKNIWVDAKIIEELRPKDINSRGGNEQ